jgi:hypothetical protein
MTSAHIGTEDEVRVRAERSGTGMGWTCEVVCAVDESGDEATTIAYVTVPRDQGN